MCNKNTNNQNSGFTLIEMLVSLALFTTVITIAIGSLLVLISTSTQVQGQQNVMTTLTFVMDSMTREIRTGKQYLCGDYSFINQDSALDDAFEDCPDGAQGVTPFGISFIEGGDSISKGNKRIAYFFNNGKIWRRVGSGNDNLAAITSDGITITRADFFVTGADSLSHSGNVNVVQPTVTIVIEATETGAPTDKPFVLETTITQRELDL